MFYFFLRWPLLQKDLVHLLPWRRALLLAVRLFHLLLASEQLPAEAKVAELVRIKFVKDFGSER